MVGPVGSDVGSDEGSMVGLVGSDEGAVVGIAVDWMNTTFKLSPISSSWSPLSSLSLYPN